MKETKLQTIAIKYMQKKKIYGYFESKVARGKSINIQRALEDHQKTSLDACESSGLCWKFSDADPRKKPLDFINAPPLTSYLAILFGKTVYLVRWFDVRERELMKREEVRKLSVHSFNANIRI